MLYGMDSLSMAMALVLILLIGSMMVAAFSKKLHQFNQDLRHINMEIQRTCGMERAYWLRKKRRLWLFWLPFYRG